MITANQLAQLERRLAFMEQQLRQIPSRFAGSDQQAMVLEIIDGATLYSGGGDTVYGIARKTSALASVASAWDPNSVAATAGLFTAETGIGRARLYINGVAQSSLVLVVHDNRSGNLISTSLCELDAPETFATVSLPVSGGGGATVTAYIPFRP